MVPTFENCTTLPANINALLLSRGLDCELTLSTFTFKKIIWTWIKTGKKGKTFQTEGQTLAPVHSIRILRVLKTTYVYGNKARKGGGGDWALDQSHKVHSPLLVFGMDVRTTLTFLISGYMLTLNLLSVGQVNFSGCLLDDLFVLMWGGRLVLRSLCQASSGLHLL